MDHQLTMERSQIQWLIPIIGGGRRKFTGGWRVPATFVVIPSAGPRPHSRRCNSHPITPASSLIRFYHLVARLTLFFSADSTRPLQGDRDNSKAIEQPGCCLRLPRQLYRRFEGPAAPILRDSTWDKPTHVVAPGHLSHTCRTIRRWN